MIIPVFTIFAAVVFSLSFLANFARKNAVVLYAVVQSLAVVAALYILGFVLHQFWLLCAGILVLIGKVFLAPAFLRHLIRARDDMDLTPGLKTPLSLLALAGMTIFSVSYLFPHLPGISNDSGIALLLASMFATFFFIANRYSKLAVLAGIFFLENATLLTFLYLGFAPLTLLLLVSLDIALWALIALYFLGYIPSFRK